MGDLEANIRQFPPFRQATECSGDSTGQSVCDSKNGMYTFWGGKKEVEANVCVFV